MRGAGRSLDYRHAIGQRDVYVVESLHCTGQRNGRRWRKVVVRGRYCRKCDLHYRAQTLCPTLAGELAVHATALLIAQRVAGAGASSAENPLAIRTSLIAAALVLTAARLADLPRVAASLHERVGTWGHTCLAIAVVA